MRFGRLNKQRIVLGSCTITIDVSPENALMFNVNNHQCTMRLDIYTDGKIKAITGGCHAWVSLSGVSFIRRIQSLLLVRSLHHSRAVGFRPEVSGKRHRTPWLTVSA